jgi:protein TonB
MLAYAAHVRRPNVVDRKTLTIIVLGHAVLLAAILTARPDLIVDGRTPPTKIYNVDVPPPPMPVPPNPTVETPPSPQPSFMPVPPAIVDMVPTVPIVPFDPGPVLPPGGSIAGSGPGAMPIDPPPRLPVRIATRLLTSGEALKPPYPNSKLRLEQEATLRLRLSIDAGGRVIAVDPVGAADPEFLAAARRHIIRSWRYKPAREDGVPVATTTVVTLAFRLDQA